MLVPCRIHGFTLIEMLVALGLIGLVLGLGLPRFGGFVERARLNGAARSVAQDMFWARSVAVKTNRTVVMSFQDGIPSYSVKDQAADTLLDGGLRDLSVDYPTIALLDASADRPQFSGRGVVVPTTTITLQSASGWQKKVVVNAVGRVRIE